MNKKRTGLRRGGHPSHTSYPTPFSQDSQTSMGAFGKKLSSRACSTLLFDTVDLDPSGPHQTHVGPERAGPGNVLELAAPEAPSHGFGRPAQEAAAFGQDGLYGEGQECDAHPASTDGCEGLRKGVPQSMQAGSI